MMNIFAPITTVALVVILGISFTLSQGAQLPSSCRGVKCPERDEVCTVDLPGSAKGTPSCAKVCTRVKVVCIPDCPANKTCTVVGPDGCQNRHATHAICLPQKTF